jgi:hypothetical protein
MTYRGIYRDGAIVLGETLDIPNGTPIEFDVLRRSRTKRRVAKKPSSKKSKRMTAEERVAAFMKGFGVSRDREEWKGRSTADIARELRRKAAGNWPQPRRAERG